MPRPALTPAAASAKVATQMTECEAAVAVLRNPERNSPDKLFAAAKTLEAAGCYARRALAKGLI